jgi:hypothetical protein
MIWTEFLQGLEPGQHQLTVNIPILILIDMILYSNKDYSRFNKLKYSFQKTIKLTRNQSTLHIIFSSSHKQMQTDIDIYDAIMLGKAPCRQVFFN